MSEYVKTEDVLSKLYLDHKDVTYIDKNAAADRIKKIQGIDIVRCKECKHRDKHHYCGIWGQPYLCNDECFCSYGEREGE